MEKITFCIPSKNNCRYLKACIPSIRKNSYGNHNISVFVDADEDGTVDWLESVKDEYNITYFTNPNMGKKLFGIGKAYDFLIEKSETDMVMVFHADMMLAKHADKYMLDLWELETVVCATRIEPPLHPEGPEKIVVDFGMWPETDIEDGFKEEQFDKFVDEKIKEYGDKVTEGLFAPWLVSKKDFNKVGGHDFRFKSAREDSDLFNRFLLAGYKMKQSWNGFVYHLTARGGQFEHGKLTQDHS